ncbi:hypothetical protein D3C79_1060910 [compost metagenome]
MLLLEGGNQHPVMFGDDPEEIFAVVDVVLEAHANTAMLPIGKAQAVFFKVA